MKRILSGIILLASLNLFGSTVHFAITNWNSSALTNAVQLIPQGPRLSGTTIISGLAGRSNTVSGSYTISNILTGVYEFKIAGITFPKALYLVVPDDSNYYEATSLITNAPVSIGNPPFVTQITSTDGTVTFTPSSGKGVIDLHSASGINTNAVLDMILTNSAGGTTNIAVGTHIAGGQVVGSLSSVGLGITDGPSLTLRQADGDALVIGDLNVQSGSILGGHKGYGTNDITTFRDSGGVLRARITSSGRVLANVPMVINVQAPPYNAVGDGTNDDTTAIQDAIYSVPQPQGGTVYLPAGKYLTSAPLWLTNNVTLTGDSAEIYANFTNSFSPPGVVVAFAGTWDVIGSDASTALYGTRPLGGASFASALKGATNIVLTDTGSLTNISAGDWLYIGEGSWNADPSATWTRWGNTRVAYHQVYSLVGTTLTLSRPLDRTFDGSYYCIGTPVPYTNMVLKIHPLTNAHVRGITVTCGTEYAAYAVNSGLTVDCSVEDCVITHWPTHPISYFYMSHRAIWARNRVKVGNFGGFSAGTYCRDEGNVYENAGWADHECAEGQHGNVIIGNVYQNIMPGGYTIGVGLGATHLTIQNCLFSGKGDRAVIALNAGEDITISGNMFDNVFTAFNFSYNGNRRPDRPNRIIVTDNIINQNSPGDNLAYFYTLPNTGDIRFSGNTINGNAPSYYGGIAAFDDRGFTSFNNTFVADRTNRINVVGRLPVGAVTIRTPWAWPKTDGTAGKNFDTGDLILPWNRNVSGTIAQNDWWAAFCLAGGTYGTLTADGYVLTNTSVLVVTNGTPPTVGEFLTIPGWSGVRRVTDFVQGQTNYLQLDSVNTNDTVGGTLAYSAPSFTGVQSTGNMLALTNHEVRVVYFDGGLYMTNGSGGATITTLTATNVTADHGVTMRDGYALTWRDLSAAKFNVLELGGKLYFYTPSENWYQGANFSGSRLDVGYNHDLLMRQAIQPSATGLTTNDIVGWVTNNAAWLGWTPDGVTAFTAWKWFDKTNGVLAYQGSGLTNVPTTSLTGYVPPGNLGTNSSVPGMALFTSGSGLYFDWPTNMVAGAATNAPWPAPGTNIFMVTNDFVVTVHAAVSHQEVIDATNATVKAAGTATTATTANKPYLSGGTGVALVGVDGAGDFTASDLTPALLGAEAQSENLDGWSLLSTNLLNGGTATNVIAPVAGYGVTVRTNDLERIIDVTGTLTNNTTGRAAKPTLQSNPAEAVLGIDSAQNFTVTSITPGLVGAQPTNANLSGWALIETNVLTGIAGPTNGISQEQADARYLPLHGTADHAAKPALVSNPAAAVLGIDSDQYFTVTSLTPGLIGAQPSSANLDLWGGIAPSTKQDTLGYVPIPTSGNLSNWSNTATSAKQDALTPGANGQVWTTLGSSMGWSNPPAGGSGTVQTNISWTAVTNLQSARVPWSVVTNLQSAQMPGSVLTNAGNIIYSSSNTFALRTYAGISNALSFAPATNTANTILWSGIAPSTKQDSLPGTPGYVVLSNYWSGSNNFAGPVTMSGPGPGTLELLNSGGTTVMAGFDGTNFFGNAYGLTNLNVAGGVATNLWWPIGGTNTVLETNGNFITFNSSATGGTVQTNISWTAVTNLQSAQVPLAVVTNAGTAAYSNANAFVLSSAIGTAAYSNSTAFVLTSAIGTAAYSNSAVFQGALGYTPGTAARSNATAFVLTPTNSPVDTYVVSATGPHTKWVAPTTSEGATNGVAVTDGVATNLSLYGNVQIKGDGSSDIYLGDATTYVRMLPAQGFTARNSAGDQFTFAADKIDWNGGTLWATNSGGWGLGGATFYGSFNGTFNGTLTGSATAATHSTNFWGVLAQTNFPSTLDVLTLNADTFSVTNPPYLNLLNATNLQSTNIVGTVASATTASTANALSAGATIAAANGANLTNLNGTEIRSGTVAAARIADLSGTYTAVGAALSAAQVTNALPAVLTNSITGNAGTATTLTAPAVITWSGPTNNLTLGYPYVKTIYTLTSDASVTNVLGVTAGYPSESIFVLTNSVGSNCSLRLPAQFISFGTAITNNALVIPSAKKAIVSVLSGNGTNWAAVIQP